MILTGMIDHLYLRQVFTGAVTCHNRAAANHSDPILARFRQITASLYRIQKIHVHEVSRLLIFGGKVQTHVKGILVLI